MPTQRRDSFATCGQMWECGQQLTVEDGLIEPAYGCELGQNLDILEAVAARQAR